MFPAPATLLRWHWNLVARKWDYTSRLRPGRASTRTSVKRLILQMAMENPAWVHRRIQGEPVRLGYPIAASTVWEIPDAAGYRTGTPASRADLAPVLTCCSNRMPLGHQLPAVRSPAGGTSARAGCGP
jgi:hypothetical protein